MGQEGGLSAGPASLQAEPSACDVAQATVTPGQALPPGVASRLRTDHAGEVGAVHIYRGVLAVTRDPALRRFALCHLATEQEHLARVGAWLPARERSHLLPLWRVAGWLTGALPALAGPRAVYITVEAVETFVEQHYAEQMAYLAPRPQWVLLRQTLGDCMLDEVHHREEAAAASGQSHRGHLARAWCALIDAGSRIAVRICRHI